MNNVIENMCTRRSVRKYRPDTVPTDVINEIIKAGLYAASGRNGQSAVIVAVTDKTVRDKMAKVNASFMGAESDPFYGAPVVLVVLADKSRPTYLYDGSLVMGNLMNAAHAVGLGSCWIHRALEVFDSAEGKEMLRQWGIDGDYEGIGHCVLGYPLKPLQEPTPHKDDYVFYVK